MRRFKVRVEIETEIEIDQAVFDEVDDDWRAAFYELRTDEQIAEHIAYNLIYNRLSFSVLDGWNLPVDAARERIEAAMEPDIELEEIISA